MRLGHFLMLPTQSGVKRNPNPIFSYISRRSSNIHFGPFAPLQRASERCWSPVVPSPLFYLQDYLSCTFLAVTLNKASALHNDIRVELKTDEEVAIVVLFTQPVGALITVMDKLLVIRGKLQPGGKDLHWLKDIGRVGGAAVLAMQGQLVQLPHCFVPVEVLAARYQPKSPVHAGEAPCSTCCGRSGRRRLVAILVVPDWSGHMPGHSGLPPNEALPSSQGIQRKNS